MTSGAGLSYNDRVIRVGSAIKIGGIIATFAPAIYFNLASG